MTESEEVSGEEDGEKESREEQRIRHVVQFLMNKNLFLIDLSDPTQF